MPVFVIFALDQPPRGASFDKSLVRVGRDPSNDIVLSGETVSREHAAFGRAGNGKWKISCVSQKNPMIVEGALVTSEAAVIEGTEVMIGSEHLIVFSENETTAKKYLGGPLVTQGRCTKCEWRGLVSKVRRSPVCPMCGATQIVLFDGAERAQQDDATTAEVSPTEAKEMWKTLKEAKHSFLERIGDDRASKRRLDEKEPLEIGTSSARAMRLSGIVFGSISVRWDGRHYVAKSAMKFPAMKINGVKKDAAPLANGDMIEVGSNRFRFVSE